MSLKISDIDLSLAVIVEVYSGPGLLARASSTLKLGEKNTITIKPTHGGIATHYRLLDRHTDEEMTSGPLLLPEERRFNEKPRIPDFMNGMHEAYGDPVIINKRAVSADDTITLQITLQLGIS